MFYFNICPWHAMNTLIALRNHARHRLNIEVTFIEETHAYYVPKGQVNNSNSKVKMAK